MGIRALEQFGKLGSKYPQIKWRDTWKVIQCLQLHISHQISFTIESRPCEGWVIPVLVLGQFGETWSNYTKPYLETQKVMQSFQHHISHWMRPYSSAKAIWGLSYTCFRVFGVLVQFRETEPQCPNFSKIVKFYYLDLWSFKCFIEWDPLTLSVKRFKRHYYITI